MNENKLGTQNIFKLCLIMGIPAVLAQLVNMLYNIVDKVYIGHMDVGGSDALAGVGICGPIIILISAFSGFVSGGGAPLAAQCLGQKDEIKARKYLNVSVIMLVFFAIILPIITMLNMNNILWMVGAGDKTITYASDYLSVYLLGTFFVQISIGLNVFITAQGKSAVAMGSVLIGAILNIALDPLFIFAFNMGVKGAALATILSQLASCIWVLVFLFNKKNVLHINLKEMKFDVKIASAIAGLGVASFVMQATESIIGFVLNKGLKDYGGDIYVSALSILQSVLIFITVPITGFTSGITPIISYNYGAHYKNRLKLVFKINLFTCLIYSIISTLIISLFPHFFVSLFTPKDDLIKLCTHLVPIFIFGMPIFAIQRACQVTFVALGQAKISLFIAFLRKIILLVPLAIILPIFFDVEGIIYAEPISDITAAIICGLSFLVIFRKILNNMEDLEVK